MTSKMMMTTAEAEAELDRQREVRRDVETVLRALGVEIAQLEADYAASSGDIRDRVRLDHRKNSLAVVLERMNARMTIAHAEIDRLEAIVRGVET